MKKPANYDNVQVNNGWVPFNAGGHEMIIKNVSEKTSKNGQPMIAVSMDAAPSDSQPEYFSKAFADDVRPDKKWPYQGTKYIMINEYDFNKGDYTDNCSKEYKSFCTACEQSNNFEINWEARDWGAQFKNKKIGAVYGMVESKWNGKTHKRAEVRWWCEFAKAKTSKVPNEKLLNRPASTSPVDDGPFSGQAIADADVPWD